MTDYTPARYSQIVLTAKDRIVLAKPLAPRVKVDGADSIWLNDAGATWRLKGAHTLKLIEGTTYGLESYAVPAPPAPAPAPAPDDSPVIVFQIVDGTIFMRNVYLSMAVGQFGALGTYSPVPEGFPRYKLDEVTNLGLYADLDGFDSGKVSPLQDTVAMGAIIERFNVGAVIDGAKKIAGNMQFGASDIVGEPSLRSGAAGWSGRTAFDVEVDQTLTLVDDAKHVKAQVTLTNRADKVMTDVRYMRSVDPDQDVSYKNLIKIEEQGGDGTGGALIAAYSPKGLAPFFYYTADERARVSTYNMINKDPYRAEAYATAQKKGFSRMADAAVNLTFALGDLAPGQSAAVTFWFGVTDDLPATLAAIKGGGA